MDISVVIPTCNRKQNLLLLLKSLNASTYPFREVIIVDSGNEYLQSNELFVFEKLNIRYLFSAPSVCIQRNIGIRSAIADWVFLCDDDIEVMKDYVEKISKYISFDPYVGAVSGLVMQKEMNRWVAAYPINSAKELFIKYVFSLSIWGEINVKTKNFFIRKIIAHYKKKGNHIAKSGWPVITDFGAESFVVPVFGLGASIIRKAWLLHSPYDETLDRYGIGDNYGVAAGFPVNEIHILNGAFVYHHQEAANRQNNALRYYRRVLALDYFMKTKPSLSFTKRYRLLWSLSGNFFLYFLAANRPMSKATFKALKVIAFGKNPYCKASKRDQKTVEPLL